MSTMRFLNPGAKLRRSISSVLILMLFITSGGGSMQVLASSHMDAPLITRDPAANTTDVYAFVSGDGAGGKALTVGLSVYPHENAAIGPNKYNFDDNVLYEIHLSVGDQFLPGVASISYQFKFTTQFKNQNTILQSYLGVVQNNDDASQNLTQLCDVSKFDRRSGVTTYLGRSVVPPNNQGNATPFYNRNNNGEMPAKLGVASFAELDKYTQQAITPLSGGYTVFAGQRDDGFFADIQSIFDLLKLRNPGVDSQAGFNLHFIGLRIPLAELGGDQQTVGVYVTTSRQAQPVLPARSARFQPQWVQVARQGNPLFNEGLVALQDKDLYSRTSPFSDPQFFRKYAVNPELATLINLLIGGGQQLAIDNNRTDIAAIFIPDIIRVDLSTDRVRLAGNGPNAPGNPDDTGYSRLGIFGGDIQESRAAGHPFRLPSQFIGLPAGKFYVPGGWPNGRRFGDDVVDIAVIALLSDLRNPANLKINDPFNGNYDGVTRNELGFNKVFPYEPTPQNGRNVVR